MQKLTEKFEFILKNFDKSINSNIFGLNYLELLNLANKDKNAMMDKVVKDAQRLMSLQMELESANYSVAKLMEDAPSFLKGRVQEIDQKRNLLANNYKNVLQENQELRREVEVLEHLVLKFQRKF